MLVSSACGASWTWITREMSSFYLNTYALVRSYAFIMILCGYRTYNQRLKYIHTYMQEQHTHKHVFLFLPQHLPIFDDNILLSVLFCNCWYYSMYMNTHYLFHTLPLSFTHTHTHTHTHIYIYIYIYIYVCVCVCVCVKRIWHWITSNTWYAFKPNQTKSITLLV